MTWDDAQKTWRVDEEPREGEQEVWPVDTEGRRKVWTCSAQRAREELGDMRVERGGDGHIEVSKKYRPNQEGALPGTWWDDSCYSASESGTKVLKDIFGSKGFDYPKSVGLVEDCLRVSALSRDAVALDYFAGSATTAHAVVNMNRKDGGRRRFLLVEMGEHFDGVCKPRVLKVTYSPEWKDGKPQRHATDEERERAPHLVKYLRLESYEDALNNLVLDRNGDQDQLLAVYPDLREDYTLRYMLDVESAGSASLLDLDQFEDPFSYTLEIGQGSVGETRAMKVDVVETFNYLIGLRVRHVDTIRGFKVVEGASPQGERVLVIWRNTRDKSSAELDEFFQKQGYNTRDTEFDVIYVNGDNNLENLRRSDETWKVRLIEDDFKRLMFDVEDV
jgi:adenine-specific DNA-methyltransferase